MNSLVPARNYPLQPILREGESLSGWCWRTYLANGHEVPTALRSAMRTIRTSNSLEERNALCQFIGLQRLKPLLDRERSIIHRWSKRQTPKWYEWSPRPRFCALCLAKTKAHLVYWDLPLVSACAVHGCQLTTHCHACGKGLSWSTLRSDWQCKCGAEISNSPVEEAPLHAVRLSKILCAATDAIVPQTVKSASCGSSPIQAGYRTRDVYEALGWLLKVRRVLTDPLLNFAPQDWFKRKTPGARMVPGRWETSVMMGFPNTINRKARLTLRRLFKGVQSTLVDLRHSGRWKGVKSVSSLTSEISAKRNPMVRPILYALETVLRRHHARIPGQETTLFNPWLSQAERHKRIEEMSAWLPHPPANTAARRREEPLKPYQVLGREIGRSLNYHRDQATNVLNVLFDATHQRSVQAEATKAATTRCAEAVAHR